MNDFQLEVNCGSGVMEIFKLECKELPPHLVLVGVVDTISSLQSQVI